MKKFLICLTTLVLFGCSTTTEEINQNKEQARKQNQERQEKYKMKTYYNSGPIRTFGLEIEGHQYIIYDGGHGNPGNIIHAAHCPCHDKTK